MERSYNDTVLGAVTLRESRRANSVSVKVSTSGAITLVYPIGYPQERAIEFMESRRERIAQIMERNRERREANPPATAYSEAELRARARLHLPQRIAHIAAATNLSYNRVTLRATCSKWGSCTSDNNISLSIYMMILPRHLIDFIIIHELCHTLHHNHSAKFHQAVNHITSGREKELERELKGYSIR